MKKLFLEVSQNSQENTCASVSFLIKLQAKFLRTPFLTEVAGEISKNTFSYRTPAVAASLYSSKSKRKTLKRFCKGGPPPSLKPLDVFKDTLKVYKVMFFDM